MDKDERKNENDNDSNDENNEENNEKYHFIIGSGSENFEFGCLPSNKKK